MTPVRTPRLTWIAVLALSLVLTGCEEPVQEAPAPVAVQPAIVTVTTLASQTWQGTIRSFGVIEALEEVNVAAELSGTVIAVHVNEGDRVEAGQLLLELDAQKRELAVEQASKQVEQAGAALEEARLKLQRRRNLAARETISQEILDNAQLTVDGASASYQQALAARQLAERELADTRITSPTDGLVDIKSVEPGEPVQAGASLITLQAVAGLRVQTWVSEADILHLQAGSEALVSPSGIPGRTFPARIEWVGVNADGATGNFPVKLVLQSGTDTLRPGMTASAELHTTEISDALILPENALVDRDRQRVVFVVEEGVARLREPQLAAGLENSLLILAGLSPGDRVIVSGQQSLVDGAPVRVSGGE